MALKDSVGDIIQGFAEQQSAADDEARLQGLAVGPQFEGTGYENEQYAGDFNPEMFDDPEAAAYQTIEEDPRVRQVQMDALQQMIDRASGAADAKSDNAQFQAMDQAAGLARGREGAIRQQAQRRGQSGAGMDSVLSAQAGQAAANRARAGNQEAVEAAAIEKLLANNGAIAGAGSVRGQDFQAKSANSDIVNRFNMFNTQARNATRQANVGMRNDAQGRNLGTKQRLAGGKADASNNSLNRRDRNVKIGHDATMQRFRDESGINRRKTDATGQIMNGGLSAGVDAMTAIASGGQSMGGGGVTKQAANGEWGREDDRPGMGGGMY